MTKRKSRRTKGAHRDAPWTPFYECDWIDNGNGSRIPIPEGLIFLRNNHYQVELRAMEPMQPWGRVIWLSIKRNDRKPLHDWRDLQRIKNEVTQPEFEAVEIYPAESRLVDTANQYHLWVFVDGWAFPYGYRERLLMDAGDMGIPEMSKAQQRPWRYHERPSDVLTPEEARKRFVEDPDLGCRVNGIRD